MAGDARPRSALHEVADAELAKVTPFDREGDFAVGAANPCSHLANAHRIRRRYEHRLMHVEGIGWHTWGPPWRNDHAGALRCAADLGRIICEEASDKAARAARVQPAERRGLQAEAASLMKWSAISESRACIEASVSLAAILPGIAYKVSDLNKDPWLLATPREVIDLRTGTARRHCPHDRITLCAGTHADASAPCPTFEAMLSRLFRANPEGLTYLQKFLGFALTGNVHPEMLPIWFGTGENGKTTLVNIVQHVMGDYACTAPPGLLMLHRGDRHPTELADLHAKRLVFACETQQGGQLNEALVKQLTGADRIRARRMHQDFYEFAPTHKLVLATNHRPLIRGTDRGVWRRIHLLHFSEVISADERIRDIDERLREEAPGILAWMVAGAKLYACDGLQPPRSVISASQEYREENDVIGAFLAECCVIEPVSKSRASELFNAYKDWCMRNGEAEPSQRAFSDSLTERGMGFARAGRDGARMRTGVRLEPPRT